ncbi:MAG: GNAT family protein [Meiothermus sp.]|nr:GNAT family protein [Meiothermus sp.]
MELRGPRVLLRPPKDEDTAEMFRLAADPALSPYVYWDPHQSEHQTWEYLNELRQKVGFFVIEFEGRPAGVIGLHSDWANHSGETETWLGAPYWGSGINTEAKVVLFDYAFGPLELKRIQAIAHVHNPRSQKALEKLGFKREGLLRRWRWIRGQPWDFYMYSLLPEEWMESRPPIFYEHSY